MVWSLIESETGGERERERGGGGGGCIQNAPASLLITHTKF